MTTPNEALSERDEIEMLLPWFVTGKLDAADRARVEAFLSREPAMRRQLDLIREEQDHTVSANEAIRAPRTLSVDAGMATVAAATTLGARQTASGLLAKVRAFFQAPTAYGVRLATAAAALIILVQSAVLGSYALRGPGESQYGLAGGPTVPGAFATVKFKDDAALARIGAALGQLGMTISDGPKAGGLYVVRIGDTSLTADQRAARVAALRQLTNLVDLALPAP